MNRIIEIARGLGRSEEGASIVEYALLLALITIVCIGAMTVLGGTINSFFSATAATI